MVAKPSGTRTPARRGWLTISPREEFLPPTCSRSASPSSENHRTLSVMAVSCIGGRWSRCAMGSGRGQPRGLQDCRMTVDISSTDLAEELIDRDPVAAVQRLGPAQLVGALLERGVRRVRAAARCRTWLSRAGVVDQPEAPVAQVRGPAGAARWSRSPRRRAGSSRRRPRAAGPGTSWSASCRTATAPPGSRRPCRAPAGSARRRARWRTRPPPSGRCSA